MKIKWLKFEERFNLYAEIFFCSFFWDVHILKLANTFQWFLAPCLKIAISEWTYNIQQKITEYFELEVTHKEHQVQLLNLREWEIRFGYFCGVFFLNIIFLK